MADIYRLGQAFSPTFGRPSKNSHLVSHHYPKVMDIYGPTEYFEMATEFCSTSTSWEGDTGGADEGGI